MHQHEGAATAVAFEPEERYVASGGMDGIVRISDSSTHAVREFRGHRSPILALAFSPDGATLLSTSNDHTIRLWDVVSEQSITIDVSGIGVRRVLFLPTGKQFASIGALPMVQLWDTRTGRSVGTLRGHTGPIVELAFSADGSRLLTASVDGTVRSWDIASGESRVLGACSNNGAAVAFGPNGQFALAASFDGAVKRWADDLPTDAAALRAWLDEATSETIQSPPQR